MNFRASKFWPIDNHSPNQTWNLVGHFGLRFRSWLLSLTISLKFSVSILVAIWVAKCPRSIHSWTRHQGNFSPFWGAVSCSAWLLIPNNHTSTTSRLPAGSPLRHKGTRHHRLAGWAQQASLPGSSGVSVCRCVSRGSKNPMWSCSVHFWFWRVPNFETNSWSVPEFVLFRGGFSNPITNKYLSLPFTALFQRTKCQEKNWATTMKYKKKYNLT